MGKIIYRLKRTLKEQVFDLFCEVISYGDEYFEPLIFNEKIAFECGLTPFTFCVAEVDKNDFGMSTKWYKIKTFNFSK